MVRYELIDVEGLATILAEDAWKEEVREKGLTEKDLYEDPDTCDKIVKEHWASSFFLLREGFLSLIKQFKSS